MSDIMSLCHISFVAPTLKTVQIAFVGLAVCVEGIHRDKDAREVNTALKALNTFGNCQRPVFSLGVSQNLHKITNL